MNRLPTPMALLQNLADYFLARSPEGEQRRTRLLVGLFLFYWLLIIWLEDIPPSVYVARFVDGFPQGLQPALEWLGNRVVSIVHPQTLRHLPFPLIGLIVALRVGATYLQDLFELKEYQVAYDYLLGAIFARSFSSITVKDGKVADRDLSSPVYLIGGPGFVTVQLGNAAVFERVGGHIHVLAQGRHRLHGYERLREVIDLRDQHGVVDKLSFTTRDGLSVEAADLQVRYRIHSNRQRKESDPYPYEEIAIRRAVYGTAVNEKGQGKWTRAVPGFIRGRVAGHLSRFTLDELLQPQTTENARMLLTHLFYTPDTRERVEQMGARIDWVGVGTITAGDEVTRQFLARWQEEQKRLQQTSDPAWRVRRQGETRDTLQWNVIKQLTNWYRIEEQSGVLSARELLLCYAEILESLCEAPPPGIEGCDDDIVRIIALLHNPVQFSFIERGLPPPMYSLPSEAEGE